MGKYLLRTSSHPMMSSSSTKWASSLVLLSPLAGPMSDEAVTMTVCFQCVGGANGLVLRTTPLGSNWQSAMRPQELDFTETRQQVRMWWLTEPEGDTMVVPRPFHRDKVPARHGVQVLCCACFQVEPSKQLGLG